MALPFCSLVLVSLNHKTGYHDAITFENDSSIELIADTSMSNHDNN